MFCNFIKFFAIVTMLITGSVELAHARDGEGRTTSYQNGPIAKTARELEAAGTPSRTRAKVIATAGTVVGTLIGEVATTTVTCIARCFGIDTGYEPGDMTKQARGAIRKMWDLDDEKGPARSRQTSTPNPPRKTTKNNGMGTFLGSQAIDNSR